MHALRDDLPVGFATFKISNERPRSGVLIPYDRPLNMYGSGILRDGRIVFGTSRPGLQVATDTCNQRFVFHQGPVEVSSWPGAVADRLAVLGRRRIWLTTDGVRWQEMDPAAGARPR